MADEKGEKSEKKKPWVFASAPTQTESYRDSPAAPAQSDDELPPTVHDSNYVPGYSELLQRIDTAEKAGQKPLDLPARLQWVHTTRLDGSDYLRRFASWQRKGYRLATEEDLKKFGWSPPPAAIKQQDGTFRKDDVRLAICDGDTAKKNKRALRERSQRAKRIAPTNPSVYGKVEEERKVRLGSQEGV